MHKRTKIFIALGVVIILSIGIYFSSYISMTKEQAVDKFVEACSQNVPFTPEWQKKLETLGVSDTTEATLAKQYCHCFYTGLFDQMDDKQVIQYAKSDMAERENLLGGAQKINEKDQLCLKQLIQK